MTAPFDLPLDESLPWDDDGPDSLYYDEPAEDEVDPFPFDEDVCFEVPDAA